MPLAHMVPIIYSHVHTQTHNLKINLPPPHTHNISSPLPLLPTGDRSLYVALGDKVGLELLQFCLPLPPEC